MMTRTLITFLLLIFSIQLSAQKKNIVKSYDDGTPEFVVWTKGSAGEEKVVKEEAYYPDGTVQYTGHYKDGVEDGLWTYYYENGNKQIEETYKNGVEDGVRYEYAPDGSLRVEMHYKKGRMAKEIRHK
jgi:antitoxin component YwqK of YwqJK toxin-antitoxin module